MSSNISKQEQKKNPQAVLDVLNWFENSSKQRPSSKYMINTTATTTATNSGKWNIYNNSQLIKSFLNLCASI